ncbi:MAG: hypothetical protein HRT57_13705 [Crocinitomicaceae bacterium]|nr:hypothetical protein [Crocinitomicaceae bacterium]
MKVRFILMLAVAFLLTACPQNTTHPVPSIPFDISINITLPTYSSLQGVSGYAYVNGGSRGIIVYRRGINDFIAFDRHSPADVTGVCAQPLTPDVGNFLMLNDTCNNAQFSLYDGSPMSGFEYGLRQYAVTWDGNQTVRIYN